MYRRISFHCALLASVVAAAGCTYPQASTPSQIPRAGNLSATKVQGLAYVIEGDEATDVNVFSYHDFHLQQTLTGFNAPLAESQVPKLL